MTYLESIEYIHSLEKFGINPGLERIQALCGQLENPQNNLKFIHVAGTNGKGSTSTMISQILIQAGYKVGLFTSPYVVSFCERIQINGEMIGESELVETITAVKSAMEKLAASGIQPTEFEAITAAAFLAFANRGCDIVVLEVGLGGRLDSTNVIKKPLVSVITSISYDHINILGDTLSKISAEKCGIIKEGGITVSYPDQFEEAFEIIESTARSKKNELIVPKMSDVKIISEDITGTNAVINGIEIKIPLIGNHMVKNCAVAVNTINALNKAEFEISDSDISIGISKVKIAARMEVFGGKPFVLLDGGHNEGCACALRDVLKKHLNGKKIIAVVGMMADKDYDTYLKIVLPYFNKVISTQPENPRALDTQRLLKTASKYCKDCVKVQNSIEAVELAQSLAGENEAIVICGSFYLASEVRSRLKN